MRELEMSRTEPVALVERGRYMGAQIMDSTSDEDREEVAP